MQTNSNDQAGEQYAGKTIEPWRSRGGCKEQQMAINFVLCLNRLLVSQWV